MEKINLNESNFNGYISYPDSKTGPVLLVLHAWWGLNDFIKQFCDRLAKEGFIAIAPDLYNGKVVSTIPKAEEAVKNLDQERSFSNLIETVDYLVNKQEGPSKKIAVIGFSLGASFASKLANARPDTVDKVVLFYGTGETNFTNIKASFLCHFAENDPYEDTKYLEYFIESLQKAGLQETHFTYPDTYHWFFESDKQEYFKAKASKLAWERTVEFLKL